MNKKPKINKEESGSSWQGMPFAEMMREMMDQSGVCCGFNCPEMMPQMMEEMKTGEEPMAMYCGIDLHSRRCYLAILNEERKLVFQGRLDNDLEVVLAALEPYREEISGIAVESTFNW